MKHLPLLINIVGADLNIPRWMRAVAAEATHSAFRQSSASIITDKSDQVSRAAGNKKRGESFRALWSVFNRQHQNVRPNENATFTQRDASRWGAMTAHWDGEQCWNMGNFKENHWRAVFGFLSPTLHFTNCIKAHSITAPISFPAATPCEKNWQIKWNVTAKATANCGCPREENEVPEHHIKRCFCDQMQRKSISLQYPSKKKGTLSFPLHRHKMSLQLMQPLLCSSRKAVE